MSAATPAAGAKSGVRRSAPRSARRRARELALQGLYQWLLSSSEVKSSATQMREQDGFDKCDAPHFDRLLAGCIAEAGELDEMLARHVDRKTSHLSPVEHAVLMIGRLVM